METQAYNKVMKLRNLLILLFLMSLTVSKAAAQTQLSVPQTTPPSLMMVVLLDDSGTNKLASDRSNTAQASQYSTARNSTDPNNIRARAVQDLITQLQIDKSTVLPHLVSVISFARKQDSPRLLYGDEQNPFARIGGNATDSEGYQQLMDELPKDRITGLAGSGDPVNSLNLVITALRARLQSEGEDAYLPVIILVTDDVPMDAFPGPWGETSRQPWLEKYIPAFKKPITDLDSTSIYRGYCSHSMQGATGVTFVAIPMGAANWIDADGTIKPNGEGNFFQDFASKLRSSTITIQNSTMPLVYPIDSGFVDMNASKLEEDLRNATANIIRDLRCLWEVPTAAQSTSLTGEALSTFTASDLFSQIQILVDIPAGGGNVTIMLPQQDIEAASEKTIDYGSTRRAIYTYVRGDKSWAGDWQVTVSGTNAAAVRVHANVDLSSLQANLLSSRENLIPGQDNRVSFNFKTGSNPLTDDIVLGSVTGQLKGSSQGTINFKRQGNQYSGDILGDMVSTSGEYILEIKTQLNQVSGVPLPDSFSFELARLQYSVGFGFDNNTDPSNGSEWKNCKDSNQRLSIGFTLGSTAVPRESVGSYAHADVYYPTPAPNTTGTPIAVMSWDMNDKFFAEIPCDQLKPGDNQFVVVRAIMPDGGEKTLSVSFNYNPPTATPTWTPNPTSTDVVATRTVTPTPLPVVIDPIKDDLSTLVTSPVVTGPLIAIIGAVLLFGIGFVFIRVWQWLFPLRDVLIETNPVGEASYRNRLLTGFRAFISPRRVTISFPPSGNRDSTPSETPYAIFRVTGHSSGSEIRVTPLVDGISINEQRSQPGLPVSSKRPETRVRYQNIVYNLTNRRVKSR